MPEAASTIACQLPRRVAHCAVQIGADNDDDDEGMDDDDGGEDGTALH